MRWDRWRQAEIAYRTLLGNNPENYEWHRGVQCCILRWDTSPESAYWKMAGCDLPVRSDPFGETARQAFANVRWMGCGTRATSASPRFAAYRWTLRRERTFCAGWTRTFGHVEKVHPLHFWAGQGHHDVSKDKLPAVIELLKGYVEGLRQEPSTFGRGSRGPPGATRSCRRSRTAGAHVDAPLPRAASGPFGRPRGRHRASGRGYRPHADVPRHLLVQGAGNGALATFSGMQAGRKCAGNGLAGPLHQYEARQVPLSRWKWQEALDTAALFASSESDPMQYLSEMQIVWMLEEADATCAWVICPWRSSDTLRSKNFQIYWKSQMDYHGYCLRKTTITAYLGLLRKVAGFHAREAQALSCGIIRAYLDIWKGAEISNDADVKVCSREGRRSRWHEARKGCGSARTSMGAGGRFEGK